MNNWIYCLLAIIWTLICSITNSLETYVYEYLLKREYSDSAEAFGGFIVFVIWFIPFYLLMRKGLR